MKKLPMKILVVDDSAATRLMIRKMLTDLNHEVECVENGVQAWEYLQKHPVDTVICDWMMPEMDGIELVEKIRSAKWSNYIYIIMLTGLSEQTDRIRGIAAGADDFLTKSSDVEELQVRLRSAQRIIDLEKSLEEKNRKLYKARKALQDDLKRANQLQTSLLPEPLNDKGLSIEWLFRPATFIGGDSFNYYYIDKDILLFYVIDISGHGVPSALLSMSIQTQLQALDRLAYRYLEKDKIDDFPRNICAELNRSMLGDSHNHYATVLYGVVDLNRRKIHFTPGGHPYALHFQASTQQVAVIERNGFPVGLLDDAVYFTHTLDFQPGDQFFIYSDGLNELTSNISNTLLSTADLATHLQPVGQLEPKKIVHLLAQKWLDAKQYKEPPDDISFVAIQFK